VYRDTWSSETIEGTAAFVLSQLLPALQPDPRLTRRLKLDAEQQAYIEPVIVEARKLRNLAAGKG
jgi:hypothetical protein